MTRRRVAVAATLLAFSGVLTADTPTASPRSTEPIIRAAPEVDDVAEVLSLRTEALHDGDLDAWLKTVDPTNTGLVAAQHTLFRRLRALPFAAWAYAPTSAGWVIRYRLEGDTTRSEVPVAPELRLHEDRWVLSSLQQSRPALWDIGNVSVTYGRRSIVIGESEDAFRQRLARYADHAVAEVDAVWTKSWSRRLVVLIPDQWADVAGLINSDAYDDYAALTTSLDPPTRRTDVRIVLNPELVLGLPGPALQSLLTHEATHVAMEDADLPHWLAEGLADHVVYHGLEQRRIGQAVPDLLRAVRAEGVPERLPTDQDFVGGAGRAYEAAHVAVRVLADHFGNERLSAFYSAVSNRPHDWEGALHEQLGWDTAEWTRRWQELIAELARA